MSEGLDVNMDICLLKNYLHRRSFTFILDSYFLEDSYEAKEASILMKVDFSDQDYIETRTVSSY